MTLRHIAEHAAISLAVSLLMAGCAGSPSGPGPVIPPPGGGGVQPTPNQPPRIESMTVQKDRIEVDEEVAVTAVVSDAETAVDQMKFEWQADVGTFSGEGPAVKWRVPKGVKTPEEYVIRLTVVEAYGTAQNGVRPEHRVAGEAGPVRVHDSVEELSDLALTFLRDFATSSVPPEACVRDFSDSCPGKREERDDIGDNRIYFEIVSSRVSIRTVSLDGPKSRVTAACEFTSRVKQCPPGAVGCKAGDVGTVRGDCILTGVYEQKRWWLCDSNFLNGVAVPSAFKTFFGRR